MRFFVPERLEGDAHRRPGRFPLGPARRHQQAAQVHELGRDLGQDGGADRIDPVKIFEDDDQRTPLGPPSEQSSKELDDDPMLGLRIERRALPIPEDLEHQPDACVVQRAIGHRSVGEGGARRGLVSTSAEAEGVADQPCHQPVRGVGLERAAARDHEVVPGGKSRAELLDQPTLPDARLTGDAGGPAAGGRDLGERVVQ